MKSIKLILSLTALLLWGAVAKAQYNPADPPDPGVNFTLTTECVPEEGGSLNVSSPQVIQFGTTVTLRAYQKSNYKFVGWYDRGGNLLYNGNPYNYVMPPADTYICAKFEYDPADPLDPPFIEPVTTSTVTLVSDPTDGGSLSGGGTYTVGERIYIRANARSGFKFLYWTRDDEIVTSNSGFYYTVERNDPQFVAHFVYNPSDPTDPGEPRFYRNLTLKSNMSGAGSIYGAGTYYVGQSVNVRAYSNTYYTFENWTDEEGEVYSNTSSFYLTMPNRDLTLTANYSYNFNPTDPTDPGPPNITPTDPGTVDKPRFVMEGIDHVIIMCTNPGVRIYYTLDGSDPNERSTLYEGPVFVDSNLLVKAIAYKDGLNPSPIGEYQVSSYKSATPKFEFKDGKLHITCDTPGAIIRYTTDFSDPDETSQVYTAPFEPEENCRVKAYSSKDGLANSDISIFVYRRHDYTVPTPQFILYEDYRLVITTSMADAIIYYTTDGTEPTRESTEYTGPITVTGNKLYKAIAVKENYFDSEIAEYDLKTIYPVPTPTAIYKGKHITLSCEDPEATIRYTLDGTDPLQGTVYTEPIPVSGDVTIKFIATREDYIDSEVVTYNFIYASYRLPKAALNASYSNGTISITHPISNQQLQLEVTDKEGNTTEQTAMAPFEFSVAEGMTMLSVTAVGGEDFFDSEPVEFEISVNAIPTFSVNEDGKVVIASETPEAAIHYTLDGSTPTVSSPVYSEPLDITEALTIKAMAEKENCFNSLIGELNTGTILVATPEVTFAARNVAIFCSTEDAQIRYTVDGSEPTKESALYEAPFLPATDGMVKARAFKNEWIPSQSGSYDYRKASVTAANPAATPNYSEKTIRITHRMPSQPLKLTVTHSDGTTTEENAVTPYDFNVEEGMTMLSVVADGGDDWFDSEVVEVPITVVGTPAFSVNDDGLVVISSDTPDVVIYYTLDGSEPTTASSVYTEPLAITEILTVKAYAVKERCFDSNIGEFPTEPVLIKKPVIGFAKRNIVMECETEGVQIRYTLDGSEPTKSSLIYDGPFLPSEDGTITARAFRSGFIPSPADSYEFVRASVTTLNPTFTNDYANRLIRLAHPVENQILNLTVTSEGGATSSQTVNAPFDFVVEPGMTNLVVVAHTNDDWFDSEAINVPITVVAAPVVSVNEDGLVDIATTILDATIYYTLDGSQPTSASSVYAQPLVITDALTIKTYAVKENCFDSNVTEFPIEPVLIQKPVISFAKRNVQIECATEGVQIRYTLDGSEPTRNSTLYEGPFLPGEDCTVKARGFRSGFIPSPTDSYVYSLAAVTAAKPSAECDYPGHVIHLTHSNDGQPLKLTVNTEAGEPTEQTVNAPHDFNVALGMTNLSVIALAGEDYFDSEAVNVPITVIATPTFIVNEDGLVEIHCATPGVTIHYTLDGSEPGLGSQVYSGPLDITTDITVKAFAVKEDCFDSDMGMFPTAPVLIEKPVISFAKRNVVISCATEGVQIRYTLDGSEPTRNSTLYEAPFLPAQDCTVKARGFRSGFIPSPTDSYVYSLAAVTAAKPEAECDYPGHVIRLTHPTPGQLLKLTVSTEAGEQTGSQTEQGGGQTEQTVTAPHDFNVALGMTNLSVIALAGEDHFDSEAVNVPITVIATPTFIVNEDGLVEIHCATPGVTIYYTLDGSEPGLGSQVYSEPLDITTDITVKAFAVKEECFDSDMGMFPTAPVLIEKPVISFAKRNVVMSCATEGVLIRYTLDGSEPTRNSELYEAPFLPAEDCTVKARSFRSGFIPSPTDSYVYSLAAVTAAKPSAECDYPGHVIRLTHPTPGQLLKLTVSSESGEQTGGQTEQGGGQTEQSGGTTEQTVTAPHDFNVALGMTNLSVVALAGEDHFDSEAVNVPITVIATPTFSINEKGRIEIACSTPDVTIHYTIDDAVLTTDSPVYSGALFIQEKRTIRAFAVKEGCFDSATATFETDHYLTPAPTIDILDQLIRMDCTNLRAEIRYTLDGTAPDDNDEATVYTEPFLPENGCTITAQAFVAGRIPSVITEYLFDPIALTLPTPEYSYGKKHLTLYMPEEEADGVKILYTLDERDPAEGIEYTQPIEFEQKDYNVRYIAVHPKRLNSGTGSFVFHADDFTAEQPTITSVYDERLIELDHPREGYPLTFTIRRDNGEETTVTQNAPYTVHVDPDMNLLTVTAAETEELFASETEISPIEFNPAPTIDFDGYYLSIDATDADNGMRILLDINGSKEMVAPGTSLHLEETGYVSGVTYSASRFFSQTTPYTIDAWFNGEKGEVMTPGTFVEALRWCGYDLAPEIALGGNLNANDFGTLRACTGIRNLDLTDARIVNALPAHAFTGTEIVGVTMPTTTTTCEEGAFGNAPELSSVIWQAPDVPALAAFAERSNPNMLLFTGSDNAPENSGSLKVVRAGRIALLDLADGYPFHTPMTFTADSVSLTRDFFQETHPDDARGWESIALPFAPTAITHHINGACAPFGDDAAIEAGAKPFWLYGMTDENGFEKADRIEAHKPYIVSVPNNELYADRFNLGGLMTFSAGVTEIEPLPAQENVAAVSYTREDLGDGAFTLNVGEDHEGDIYGSVFVQGLRRLRPFEGYFSENVINSSRKIALGDALADIGKVTADSSDGLQISAADGRVTILSDRDRKVVIADMAGCVIRIVDVKAGETTDGGTLAPGIYLIADRKFAIR